MIHPPKLLLIEGGDPKQSLDARIIQARCVLSRNHLVEHGERADPDEIENMICIMFGPECVAESEKRRSA